MIPWIRWDRGPTAPDQAVLVDMPGRRLYFFFIEIWPQEIYYLTFLLMAAAFGLFLATAIGGRVWCGFTCPHRPSGPTSSCGSSARSKGDRSARIRLDKQPWSRERLCARRAATHVSLAADRGRHGRCVDHVLQRCANRDLRGPHRPGEPRRLFLLRPLHFHNIPSRWLGPGAGLHLYVPLAAYPGRLARSGQLRRHL